MITPQSTLDELNRYTARSAETWGVPVELLQAAVKKTLEEKKYANYLSRAFNGPAMPLKNKISHIARFIAAEQKRGAPWINARNAEGNAPYLLNKSIRQLYNMARAQEKKTPLAVPDIEGRGDEFWGLYFKETPEEFYCAMTAGLPAGTKLEMNLNPDGTPWRICYHYAKDGTRIFNFERLIQWDLPEKTAEHQSATVDDPARGKGIAKIINAHLFRFYQRLGIDTVFLRAVEIGAYAWGRIGFVPWKAYWPDIQKRITARLDILEQQPDPNEAPLPPAYIASLRQALTSVDPKSFWFIVDQDSKYHGSTIGKLLTLPLKTLPDSPFKKAALYDGLPLSFEWHGSLNMKDPECVQRFTAYHGMDKRAPALNPTKKAPG